MSKTVLITGATDGIGLLTAQKLAGAGHKVLLHGRSQKKLDDATAAVGDASKAYRADLSVMGDVEKLANAILARHDRLDVLINNAGVLKSPTTRTEAGRDIRFDVNTIAPFILTHRLLPIMADKGRVVNLSSAAQAPVDVSSMTTYHPMGDMEAYAQSKLAITLWTEQMARLHTDGPLFVSVNPGSLLATKMVKEGFGVAGNDLNIGADILVTAALSPEFADASGKYYDNDSQRFAPPHPAANDPAQVRAVMSALSDITGLPQSG